MTRFYIENLNTKFTMQDNKNKDRFLTFWEITKKCENKNLT